MRSRRRRWAQRVWFALVLNGLSCVALLFVVPFVILLWGGTVSWRVWALALAVCLPWAVYLGITDIIVEGKMRKLARRKQWTYSLWGPRAVEYGISAPPFPGAGRLRTSMWAKGSFQGRPFETFYVDTDAVRLGQQIYVLAVRLDREYPTVRLTPAEGGRREMQGQVATTTEAVEFARRWRVQGADPEFAHAFLSPLVVARLLAEPDPPKELTLSGRYIFVSGKLGNVLTTGRLPLLADLVELIPDGVVAKFSQGRRPLSGASVNPMEVILAHDRPRDATIFALPSPRPWVGPVAFSLAILVPVIGPVVSVILLGREARRGVGSSWMMEYAIALGFAELIVAYVWLFVI